MDDTLNGDEEMPVEMDVKVAATPSSKGKSLSGKGKKRASTVRKKPIKRKKEAISDHNDDSGQDAGEYAVEKIVDKRVVDGSVQYFIKWQGWEEDSNTWEPIEHLGNCHLMIQTYESKLAASRKKKTPGKRGRSSSVASSVVSPSVKSSTSSAKFKKRGRKSYLTRNQVVEQYSDSEDELTSGVEDEDVPISIGVLSKCPLGKEIAKIHAVAVVDGYLTFLVQWKTKESPEDKRPPLCETNSNMVRAMSLNEEFPQDIIRFYEQSIRFNICMDPVEQEAVKAAQARVKAEERKRAAALKKQSSIGEEEEDTEDAATKAITKSERKYDSFNPLDSDLTSSSDDFQSPDEDEDTQH